MLMINNHHNITNRHNRAGADNIRPRTPRNFSGVQLVGCGDLDAPLPRERHKIPEMFIADRCPHGCPLSAQPIQQI